MKSGRDSYLNLFRYYHTLKNFKVGQIIAYFIFKYRRKWLSILDLKSISNLASSLKENYKFEEDEKLLKLNFFNKLLELNIEKINWNSNDFNLESEYHWLEYLNSFEWLFCKEENVFPLPVLSYLILDWISKNIDEHTNSWAPFVLSKRLVSWTKWLHKTKISLEVSSIMKLSIYLQLKRLFVDFEYHIPGNHLIENIRGYLVGCAYLIEVKQYFNNELEFQLEQVLEDGIKQVEKQILADGAHFERSPMYHVYVLEALRDIEKISSYIMKQKFLESDLLEKAKILSKMCKAKICNMSQWLEAMTMPDGEISQFGDSSRIIGIKSEVKNYEKILEPSGFFVKNCDDFSFIMSCNTASPAFLPEHSHCDILSYELAINGCRCIVDTGYSGYDNDTLRNISRETDSHNLPMVQGHEQSDIWGRNNIGKRARIIDKLFNSEKSVFNSIVEDQYGQIIERKIEFSNKSINISDLLKKRRMQGCFISLIHLSPEISIDCINNEEKENIIICKMTNGQKFSIITNANIRIDDYISFPYFGKSVGAKKLILSNKESEELSYVIKW